MLLIFAEDRINTTAAAATTTIAVSDRRRRDGAALRIDTLSSPRSLSPDSSPRPGTINGGDDEDDEKKAKTRRGFVGSQFVVPVRLSLAPMLLMQI